MAELILVFLGGMVFGAAFLAGFWFWIGQEEPLEGEVLSHGNEGGWLWTFGQPVVSERDQTGYAELAEDLHLTRGRETPTRPLHLIEGGDGAEDQ